MDAGTLFQALGLLGSGGLAAMLLVRPQIKKLRAEAHRVDVDAAIAEDEAAQRQFQTILAAQKQMIDDQVTVIVTPLRSEVEGLRNEVRELRVEVKTITRRWLMALDVIRAYVRFVATHMTGVTAMPPPIPNEIADEL